MPLGEVVIFLALFLISWLLLSLAFSIVKVKGIDLKPFLLIIRVSSQKIDRVLSKLTSRGVKVWSILLDAGVALGFGLMAFSLYFLVTNLFKRFTSPEGFVAIVPPIPGLALPLVHVPYFLIALSIAIIAHELAHAAASKLLGVKIKSFGAALLAVILAAFVELDEETLGKTEPSGRLKIFAAGSFANLALFVVLLAAFVALFQPGGAFVYYVEESTPAFEAGIVKSCVIKRLNSTYILNSLDLNEFMRRSGPGQIVAVGLVSPEGSWREVVLRTTSHPNDPSRGFLGILPLDFYELRLLNLPPSILIHIHTFYAWLQAILFSLAVFNMLPMAAVDGGKMMYTVIEEVAKSSRLAKRLLILLTAISLCLVALNVTVTLAPLP
ncbi:MAG: site-2 protease family protein [Candidatus Nezhaarchaeota archaeon]|nr:site-2 protease family protein [Candidatus Nezhaarchaeota archaeon]